MFEQSRRERLSYWAELDNATVAHAFMDAAGHMNGDVSSSERLASQLGLFIDTRSLRNDDRVVHDSLSIIFTRLKDQPELKDDPYIGPISKALETGRVTNAEEKSEIIVAAVKGLRLPPADIKKSSFMMMS